MVIQRERSFDLHIGIDYSGRETPTSRTPALQVYAAFDTEEPRRILSPSSTEKTYKNWCRKEIAEWLVEQAETNITFIAGIDHGFSVPGQLLPAIQDSSHGRSSSMISASTGRPTTIILTSISSVTVTKARQIAPATRPICG